MENFMHVPSEEQKLKDWETDLQKTDNGILLDNTKLVRDCLNLTLGNCAYGFQRNAQEMTQARLVPQNKLNGSLFVEDWFCLLREFSSYSLFVLMLTNYIFSTHPACKYNLHQALNRSVHSLLQLACPKLQFFCYSWINSSFRQFWACLILPFH